MTETMLESGMTDGQIDDLADKLRDAARERRGGFNKDAVHFALQSPDVGMRLVGAFRMIVEDINKRIVRVVTVSRGRTPKQALDACGRRQNVEDAVVDAMPRGEGDRVEVVLFPVRYMISDDDAEKEYERRGLKPADPYSLAAVNEDDPGFSYDYPNKTHWKDADGCWCSALFGHWGGTQSVGIGRCDDSKQHDGWWLAGLHK